MPSGLLHYLCCMLPGSLGPAAIEKYWGILRKPFRSSRRKHRLLLRGISNTFGFSGCFFNMGAFQKSSVFLHEWALFIMKHQVVSVSSEGTAIPQALWHFPSVAMECFPAGTSIFCEFHLSLHYLPLSKPQLQRVRSTGICLLCLFSFFLALPFWRFYMRDCGILVEKDVVNLQSLEK